MGRAPGRSLRDSACEATLRAPSRNPPDGLAEVRRDMKNWITSLALLVLAPLYSALPVRPQAPVVVDDEITSDDDEPFSGEIEIHHKKALVVKTADLDEDGVADVVIGGVDPSQSPDHFSARVHYLNRWGIRHSEALADLAAR